MKILKLIGSAKSIALAAIASPKASIYAGLAMVLAGSGLILYKSFAKTPVTADFEETREEAKLLRQNGSSALPVYTNLLKRLCHRYGFSLGLEIAGCILVIRGVAIGSAIVTGLGTAITSLENDNDRLRKNLSVYNQDACMPNTIVSKNENGEIETKPAYRHDGFFEIYYCPEYLKSNTRKLDPTYDFGNIKSAIDSIARTVRLEGCENVNMLIDKIGLIQSRRIRYGTLFGYENPDDVDVLLVLNDNVSTVGTMSIRDHSIPELTRALTPEEQENGFWIRLDPKYIGTYQEDMYDDMGVELP